MANGKRTKEHIPSRRQLGQEEKSKAQLEVSKHHDNKFSSSQDKELINVSKDSKEFQSADFMLKEYERLSLLKMDEVKQSEQRVTFFLTIASAAVGLIVILTQTSTFPTDKILVIARVSLIVLLLFGMNILNRMNARFVQLKTFNHLMSEIRSYFGNLHPEIAAYSEKHDKLFQSPNYRSNITKHVLRRFRGTLSDLLILSNALICGGIAYIEFYSRGYQADLIVGLTITIIIGALVFLYMYYYFFIKRIPPFG